MMFLFVLIPFEPILDFLLFFFLGKIQKSKMADQDGCRHVTSSRGGARTLKGHFQMYYPPFNSRCHSFNILGVTEGG